jgi:adenosine deaminase
MDPGAFQSAGRDVDMSEHGRGWNGGGRADALATLRADLHAMPKVDLHRHLEGSLRLKTLSEIAQEHGIDLPSYEIEYLRPFVTVTSEEPDFQRFLEKFRLLRRFYPSQAAVERIAYEAVADAAADNIKYLELRFNPVAQARVQGFSLSEVTGWTCGAVGRAAEDFDVKTNLIIQIGRDESLDVAAHIVDVALAHRDQGVVGLDLAGDESSYPARRFMAVFRRAREEGLNITVHAGEAGAAENVREAVELLGARRIGHGVRAVENSNVLQLVRARGITFEICPTSNLQTGVVRRFGQHPLHDMLALGLRVTINTDDPSISDTTLTDEYLAVILAMGVNLEQIQRSIIMGVEASFQSLEERQRMAHWFRQQFQMS